MNLDKKEPTGLLCPITGVELLYRGHEIDVRDGLSFYSPIDNTEIVYGRHPFNYHIYFTIAHYGNNWEVNERWFRLNDDKTWIELIKEPVSGDLFTIDTPKKELKKHAREYTKEYKLRQAEHKRKVASGEIIPGPKFKRVYASTVRLDIVEVKPMSSPICELNYLDFKY